MIGIGSRVTVAALAGALGRVVEIAVTGERFAAAPGLVGQERADA